MWSSAPLKKCPLIKKLGVPVNPSRLASAKIALHRGSFLAGVQTFVEARRIQLQSPGMLLKGRGPNLLAVKQEIMKLPKFSLLSGATRSSPIFPR